MIFNLSTDHKLTNGSTNFIPLGNHHAFGLSQIEEIEARLPFSKTEKINEIWGTLGWKDDKLFQEQGIIEFSESGQLTEAKGATLRQIEMLYDIYPEIPVKKNKVRERYIDLNKLEIEKPGFISLKDMKELRLDIFLENNEGAVVYLQHSEKNNYNEEEAFIEYISPQPTDEDNRLDLRNRLTYHIPFQFGKKLKPDGKEDGSEERFCGPVNYLEVSDEDPDQIVSENGELIDLEKTGFIIKILTFVRSARTPEEALKGIGSAIARETQKSILKSQLDKLGKNKYALLKFVPEVDLLNENGQFVKIETGSDIDLSVKTLILVHGTFKDTYGTFDNFITKKYLNTDHNFLNFLIKNGYYEQILAFDHPYFWDTPEENAQWLIDNFLKDYCFAPNLVDLLGASRGGLLAMHLAISLKSANLLKVRKVLIFSGGPSGFVDSIAGLSKWISVMNIGAPVPLQKLLLGIASIGLSYIGKNSGLAAMKSNSPFLEKLYGDPLEHPVIFKAMVADWNRHLVSGKGRLDTTMKRVLATGLDTVLKLFLGWQHDWVIGSAGQRKLPQGFNAFPEPSYEYSSMHGKYFLKGYPQFKADNKWQEADVYHEILNFLE
ncbi:hypothetical protein JKA74_05260 [Marivirga sp. S37H4]|uniref:DUF7379 domain-containing protein n=1 Tax=Marivirga aurantiaca TaxID=2802615 RepID=A0A934WWX4_9BACT|nr:hypothetical protein [Marivirga aurantiaca]MBK6264437.1 hypothetical protein [Marivirga aurantiaca]